MSLPIDQHLATGEVPAPGGDLLTGRYACYDVYAARDGKWLAVAAIEPAFFAQPLQRRSGSTQWIPHQLDDARQDEIRADFRRVFATRDRDDWVARAGAARHLRRARLRDVPSWPTIRSFRESQRVRPTPSTRGTAASASSRRCWRGPIATRVAPTHVATTRPTDTDALLRAAGVTAQEIDAHAPRRSGRVRMRSRKDVAMDLDFSEEQQMLRDTVRGVLRRARADRGRARDGGRPDRLPGRVSGSSSADLGVLGLTLPEALRRRRADRARSARSSTRSSAARSRRRRISSARS